MNGPSSLRIALQFIEQINRHDVDAMCALMTDDHRFVDGLGNEVRGRDNMREPWRTYFSWFPDYTIIVERSFERGDAAAMVGNARGTYAVQGSLEPGRRWVIPAAWLAIVREGLVAEWRVYADNEPVWKIMGVKRY
jgi:ketosteroid isomerase-like protein